ncbi:MAG: ABC transporter permease [Pyrinomonadaceae bacterium]|nr:ABC transporter permease [Pyrinomonadaceae bacterium]
MVLFNTETAPAGDSTSALEPLPHQSSSLPDKPLIVIEPSKSWVALDLKDLWAYRELLYFLTWRDVKVRYKQTLLGATWAIMQPLFTMLIFTLLFGKLAGMPSDGIPYPIFAYVGLLPWTFFQTAVTNSSNSLVGSSNLITKVYFPRMIIPGAAVGAGLVDFAIAFIILVGLMVYYGVAATWNIMMLPALVVLITLLALSIGMCMSALNVKYRDIRYALPFLIQLWMFCSPIIYPSSLVPGKWRWVLVLNPLTGIIEGFRSSLLNREFDWTALGVSTVITLFLLVYSAYAFRRMEKSFADIV